MIAIFFFEPVSSLFNISATELGNRREFRTLLCDRLQQEISKSLIEKSDLEESDVVLGKNSEFEFVTYLELK